MTDQYNWDAIRRDYVQGFVVVDPESGDRRIVYPTFVEVAEKYGCNRGTVSQKANASEPTWGEQRSALKAKLSEHEDGRRISYYISESAGLDAETIGLVRHHMKLVRHYLEQFNPLLEEGMVMGLSEIEAKFSIDSLEKSSRTLKNLQEIGRRAVSEPVAGVRDTIAIMDKQPTQDANALRSQVERLQKRLKERDKQKQDVDN